MNTLKAYEEIKYKHLYQALAGIADLTSWIWEFVHHEKYLEIKGIVKGVNDPAYTVPKAVLTNTIYEMGTWCTSVVVKQTDGTIIHSRNLDHSVGGKDVIGTFIATYTKGGQY